MLFDDSARRSVIVAEGPGHRRDTDAVVLQSGLFEALDDAGLEFVDLNEAPAVLFRRSMHPIEHVIYFSTILLFFLIPSHPIHMINLASRLGLAPAQGHTGFDRVVVGEEASMDTSYFAHYLHHKYFEVNYSDGMVPLDKWFGSFHDGTPEANEAMKARRLRRGV